MQVVIATHNPKKLAELQRILEPLEIDAVTADLEDVEETGSTFAENAFLKAQAACKQTGVPAVADDSGLVVDALNGAPGIYSARYAGEGASDAQLVEKLLREMQGVSPENRTARFVCAICCVFPDDSRIIAEAVCEGRIGDAPQGDGGFGYDPVFLVGEQSFSQLSAAKKDEISHRGKALQQFAEKLKYYQLQRK